MAASSARIHLLVLILLSGLVISFNLGSSSLHNQDEALHAVVAHEAATQGNWLPLTDNDSPYFNKPPLRIWLMALIFKAAGINEWTVRLWSAVFGLGTVLALYLVGRRLGDDRTAFFSSLILLTDVATLEQIRQAVPELALPDRPLAQPKGMLLLRLPEE
jgi:4-amino-4-deoxy-L-arabinose transferase-like glycosyltransferase